MRVFSPRVDNRVKVIARIVALLLPVLLVLPLLTQNASAKTTTYVIKDGDQTIVHTTSETNPVSVLKEAGFTLDANDLYTTAPGDDVSEITVQRSQTITIHYCGETIETATYGETLETLLNRLGLVATYGTNTVSLPLSTQTYDGMEVTVTNTQQMEQTYTQEVPYETVYCYDPSLPEGEQILKVPGKNGQKQIHASVVYENSKELTRTVLKETVLTEVVNEIIIVGTGEMMDPDTSAFAIGDGVIITPEGEILTYSKYDTSFKTTAYTHTDEGCDMTTATGTTVRIGTVAVDPTVIPYGTRMFILSNDGQYVYGIATAEDCGGGVKGKHIDLYFPTDAACWTYGVRTATVYFLD